MSTWQPIQPVPVQEIYTTKRRVERRSSDLRSDVLVPITMALVSGVLVFLVGLCLWYAVDWLPFEIAPLAGLATVIAVWVWRMRQYDAMLYAVEEMAHKDINGDGVIGPATRPQPAETRTYTTRLEVTEKKDGGSVRLRMVDLPCSDATLALFARAALAGQSLAERQWAGDGKPFSSGVYRQTVDRLMGDELLEWGVVNGKRTRQATDKSRQVFTEFLAEFDRRNPPEDE